MGQALMSSSYVVKDNSNTAVLPTETFTGSALAETWLPVKKSFSCALIAAQHTHPCPQHTQQRHITTSFAERVSQQEQAAPAPSASEGPAPCSGAAWAIHRDCPEFGVQHHSYQFSDKALSHAPNFDHTGSPILPVLPGETLVSNPIVVE